MFRYKIYFFLFSFFIIYGCESSFNNTTSSDIPSIDIPEEKFYSITLFNGDQESTYSIKYGSGFTIPKNTIQKDGYSFTGWSLSKDSSTVKYTDNAFIEVVYDNINLYAVWLPEIVTHTITFYSNSGQGSMEPINVEKGQNVILNHNKFIKKGYIFAGWAKSPDGEAVYPDGADVLVTENMHLYAVWQKVEEAQCLINFYHSGGEGDMQQEIVQKDSLYTLPSSAYTRRGFIFDFWYTEKNGIIKRYKPADAVKITEDTTFFIMWKLDQLDKKPGDFTLKLDANSNTGFTLNVYAEPASKINIPDNPFIKQGYVFLGWCFNPESTNPDFVDSSLFTINADTTLYAVWGRNEDVKKLSFDANGGEGYIKPVYMLPGSYITLPYDIPYTRYNYTFEGWNDEYDNGIQQYFKGSKFTMGSNDVTLYAVWWVKDSTIGGASKDFAGTTQWVKGITPPKDSDWVDSSDFYAKKTVKWQKGLGWYDINKVPNDPTDDNLCWLASAVNALHWWLDQNNYYVTKYGFSEKHSYHDSRNSDIFNYLKKIFPNEGNWPQRGFIHYIAGYGSYNGGHFFDKAFPQSTLITKYNYGNIFNRRTFNELLEEAFKVGAAVSFEVRLPSYPTGHAMTIWGARFDKEGFIDRIYFTDSDDTGSNGMLYSDIEYDHKLKPYLKDYAAGAEMYAVTLFYLKDDIWKEYFNKK